MKISLIFACYNVSKYLDDLYELLISQPYKNVEFIFVDDCSTDNTKTKILSFKDRRVKTVLNKENIGAACSRNNGIDIATGDYISFVDPDDMFDKNLLERISKIVNNYNPDVIDVGMQEIYEIDNIVTYRKNIISKYSGFFDKNINDVLIDLEYKFLFGSSSNKFYKKEIIDKHHIRNEHQALKEDFEFNIKFFREISNLYVLNEPFYFYMKRNNGSLTAKFVPDYFPIHMKTLSSFIKLLQVREELNQNAIELVVNRFIRYTLSAIERNTSPNANLTLKAQKDWIIGSVYNQEQFKLMVNNAYLVSKKQKPIYFLLKYKMSSLLVLLGNFVKLVKSKLPILFTKLKG